MHGSITAGSAYLWKYPEELRDRATQVGCAGARRDPERSRGRAEELGGPPLRCYAPGTQEVEIDAGARPGTTTSDAERVRELEAENRELRRANAIPTECVTCFSRPVPAPPIPLVCEYVDSRKEVLRGLCRFCLALTSADVKFAPSTFYAARSRPSSARSRRDEVLKAEIGRVHEDNYCVLGSQEDTRHAGPA